MVASVLTIFNLNTMKSITRIISVLALVLIGLNVSAQSAKTVKFVQTPGEFTTTEVTLTQGSYIFEVTNDNATDEVGFVLVPKGKDASKPENHISEAYVTKTVQKGQTEKTGVINLEKGEYIYFCPLNKTPQYTLTVK